MPLDSTKKLAISPSVVLAHSAQLFLDTDFQEELAEARNRKIAPKTGVSLYSESEINQVLESTFKPEVIQLPMNILDNRLYRRGLLDRIRDKGIMIHARSAFLQGLFYLPEADLKARFADVVPYITKLKNIAVEAGLTLAELSLLWLVNMEELNKVIIGLDNLVQLNEHLETLNKNVDPAIFEESLSINYENENILNPSLWL